MVTINSLGVWLIVESLNDPAVIDLSIDSIQDLVLESKTLLVGVPHQLKLLIGVVVKFLL
jgi:hypothetical protein